MVIHRRVILNYTRVRRIVNRIVVYDINDATDESGHVTVKCEMIYVSHIAGRMKDDELSDDLGERKRIYLQKRMCSS